MVAWTGDQQQKQQNHHRFVSNPFDSLTNMWYQDCGSATARVVRYDDEEEINLVFPYTSFREGDDDDYYYSSRNQMDTTRSTINDAAILLRQGQGGRRRPLQRAAKWMKKKLMN